LIEVPDISSSYKEGFITDIKEVDAIPAGLNEDIIKLISSKKNKPEWLLNFRLKAYEKWKTMAEPHWAYFDYEPIDYQKLVYYSAPSSVSKKHPKKIEDVDPELIHAYNKLGIPLEEQKVLSNISMDVVWDSDNTKGRIVKTWNYFLFYF
jgi:Fe-S cluster assembly protein SufB